MTRGYVMAATDANGNRLAERTTPTAPTLGEAAAFAGSHQADYVSVRRDGHDDVTLYGQDASGAWVRIVANAPAVVVVELRRQHDAQRRAASAAAGGGADRAGGPTTVPGRGGHLLAAVTVDGEPLGEPVRSAAPTLAEAAGLGERHEANYVLAGRDDDEAVTLYARDAGGSWSVVAAEVDGATAEEVRLWFDLTQHYQGRSATGDTPGGTPGHPLDHVPTPEGGPMTRARAVALVAEWLQARRLDYPTEGLVADRFEGGWSVYAPVEVDESDPMAFLDMPVGRSVFLVSDVGRVKEVPSSVPPRQVEELFAAEEAYVRRGLAEERFLADLRDEVTRRDAASGGAAGIGAFTVDSPDEEVVAARASRLLDPIAQQLAALGPPGWDRFVAAFSFTVSAEVAQLRFWCGERSTDVRVPEQTAVLVRRQRHIAGRLPAGPWWRLLIAVHRGPGGDARIVTDYDYGDEPLPEEHLLAPAHYRHDLAAYPRAHVPRWLAAHLADADASRAAPSGAAPGDAAPRSAGSHGAAPATGQPRPDPPPEPGSETAQPVLDTRIGRKRLYADPQLITFGRHTMRLDEAEWLSYSATHTATRRFLFPTTHDNSWTFAVGRYPYHGGPAVRVFLDRAGRRTDPPEEWVFLVELAMRHLAPRLLAGLVAHVRRGETVTVGGSLEVSQTGVSCRKPRLSLPWESLGTVQVEGGMVWVFQRGARQPVWTVPLSHPNAVLIPDLFATLGA